MSELECGWARIRVPQRDGDLSTIADYFLFFLVFQNDVCLVVVVVREKKNTCSLGKI